MKVFVVSTLAVLATVCADKSAPYPASGSKPTGPVFLLPTNKQAPAAPVTKAPVYVYPYAPAALPNTPASPEPTTAKPERIFLVEGGSGRHSAKRN